MTHDDQPHPSLHRPPLDVRAAVWGSAANCRLYERDPGPAHYTESPGGGFAADHPDDSRTVTRAEAWRDIYARGLIHDLHADPTLIWQAVAFSVAQLREVSGLRYRLALARREWRGAPDRRTARRRAVHVLTPTEYTADREFWRLGVDIATRAHHITHNAGADTNPFDRDRLLAGIDHRLHLVFSFIPEPTASAARLASRLEEIDRQAEADWRLPPGHPDKRT